jgi:hypothetical protein
VFLIEIAEAPEVVAGTSVEGLASAGDLIGRLDDLSATIAEVCDSISGKVLAGLRNSRPDMFEIEFGVKLAGEAGIPLVTKGTAEGTLKVTAKWGKA